MELKNIDLRVKDKYYFLISEEHATKVKKIIEILNSQDLKISDLEMARSIAWELALGI